MTLANIYLLHQQQSEGHTAQLSTHIYIQVVFQAMGARTLRRDMCKYISLTQAGGDLGKFNLICGWSGSWL